MPEKNESAQIDDPERKAPEPGREEWLEMIRRNVEEDRKNNDANPFTGDKK